MANILDTQLDSYREIIDYSWENMEEHLEWINTASVEEIISWAKQIKADEEQFRMQEED